MSKTLLCRICDKPIVQEGKGRAHTCPGECRRLLRLQRQADAKRRYRYKTGELSPPQRIPCGSCGKEFMARAEQRYCSARCRMDAKNQRRNLNSMDDELPTGSARPAGPLAKRPPGKPRLPRPDSLSGRLGSRVELLRKRAGLTSTQLAAAAGISSGSVQQLERGSVSPKLDTVAAIAGALGVSPAKLLRGVDGWG